MSFDKGLAKTVAAETEMSFIDGERGVLEYVGIDIDSLARNATFEEVVYLLWNRRLPTRDELGRFVQLLRSNSELPEPAWDMIRSIPPDAAPMHALQTMVSSLALFDPEADINTPEANDLKAVRLLSKTPALIANFDRHRKGLDMVRPRQDLSIAGGFIYMLTGEEPTETMERALDVCLILHADHGLNASTFASRVCISTLSDLYSAITAAIGTLRGPLHGGANEAVMHMLDEIGSMDDVESYLDERLRNKDKIMGFGHRVYKTFDPRATYLKTFAEQLAADTGNTDLYQMSRLIEQIMHERVGDRGIHPNVDFYSATTYFSIGLDVDLFTPMFAMSRIAGWAGHCIEQLSDNRLIRPKASYVGPHEQPWVDIDDR
ncbi:MAG: citrate synthase [Phycisphaerae bacterium]|nr:citrate synthase [Phycisphaerae bacterium]